MKVRVKLSGMFKAVDVGEVDQCTLLQLLERTADVFLLGETPFTLSLNKRDSLSGEDQTLSQLGIVPGDLLFVLCPDRELNNKHDNSSHNAILSASSSSGSCASTDGAAYSTHTPPHGSDVTGHEDDAVCTVDSGPQVPEAACEENVSDDQLMSAAHAEDVVGATAFAEDRECVSTCPLEDPVVNRCLQEPMLCRESTPTSVPAQLRDMFTTAACSSATDALWVVVHTLMLEVGFRPLQGDSLSLEEGWNRGGFYKQQYRHLSVNAQHSCSLIGVPMGQVLIVHGVTGGDALVKTNPLQLKVTDCVHGTNIQQDVCKVYKNLGRLSRTVKDLICQPLMSQLSEVCGFPVAMGLLSFSYELKLKVLSYLSASSLTRLGQVCRDLNATYKDPCLWRRLHLREFGQNGDNSLNKNWYQLYKHAYQQRKEWRRLSRHRHALVSSIPPWLSPPPGYFPPLVPAPYPSGVIGGDYDLNPEFAPSIPHPLIGQPRVPDPFLPHGPGMPGGPFHPRPHFDDPFNSFGATGRRLTGLGGSAFRSCRTSSFSSAGRLL